MAGKVRGKWSWLGWLALGGVGLAAVIIVGGIGFLHLIAGGCGASHARRVASPDGRWEAVSYDYDCGATTGYHTEVSIVRAGAALKGPGNVLSTAWGSASTDWVSADTVRVRYSTPGPIDKIKYKRGPVKVIYQPAS